MPPQQPLTLLWNDRPVGVITDWALIDWPWVGGTFTPSDFPKDLADLLTWRRQQPHDEQEEGPWEPSTAWFLQGHWGNWSIRFPDGRVQEVWVTRIEQAGGEIEWR